MALTVYDTNTGTHRTPTDLDVYDANTTAWRQVKQLYVIEWVLTGDPGLGDSAYTKTWRSVASFEAPTESVPSPAVVQFTSYDDNGTTYYQVQATWTPVGSGNPAEFYSVDVDFYQNGIFSHNDTASQSAGSVLSSQFLFPPEFDSGDEVYAIVNYRNSAGDGPTTQTSSIFVGPV